jgi:hypothetical protein
MKITAKIKSPSPKKDTYPCIKQCINLPFLLLVCFIKPRVGYVLVDEDQQYPFEFLHHYHTWDESKYELVTDPITLTIDPKG